MYNTCLYKVYMVSSEQLFIYGESIIAQCAEAAANAQLICMHCQHARIFRCSSFASLPFPLLSTPSASTRTIKSVGECGNSSLGNCKSRQAQSTNWLSKIHTHKHNTHLYTHACIHRQTNTHTRTTCLTSNTLKLSVCKNTFSIRN